MICRQPFACSDTCHCTPDPGVVARDRFEASAATRAEMAKRDRLTLAMVFAVTGFASFTTLYVVAAVVDQGIQNWSNVRIANVEP
jgi:hypothetical protein